MKIIKYIIYSTAGIALIFMTTILFQISSYKSKATKLFDKEVSAWVGNNITKNDQLDFFVEGCMKKKISNDEFKKKIKNFDKNIKVPVVISKSDCARKLGFDELAAFIKTVDYSTIDVPFPLSLLTG